MDPATVQIAVAIIGAVGTVCAAWVATRQKANSTISKGTTDILPHKKPFLKTKTFIFFVVPVIGALTVLSLFNTARILARQSKESCSPLILSESTPPVKLHIFNGDRNSAERKAYQTGVLVTHSPRNVLGTDEDLPAFECELPSNIPVVRIIRVSGTYEIHANDFEGGVPAAFIATTVSGQYSGTIINKVPIQFEGRLKVPIEFTTEIDYPLDQVKGTGVIEKVGLYVSYAGSWGFFLNKIKFEVCGKK